MSRRDSAGQFEQLVLTAVVALKENAYGVTIHKKVQELARPKTIALGAVYVTLDRLEDKRFLSSWLSEPTSERGGRAKRCYRIQPAGVLALEESTVAARRMWDVLDEVWGGRRD
jgi:PadR family transcriptional regulator, regulatory protein PadR